MVSSRFVRSPLRLPPCRHRAWALLALLLVTLPLRSGAADKITYNDQVRPILAANCFTCHDPDKRKAGLNLTTYQGFLTGSSNGKIFESGDPDSSLIYLLITHQEEPHMPPKGGKLADKDLDLIRRWLADGALEGANSVAAASNKPKIDLKLVAAPADQLPGPGPMPGDLSLQPVVHASRAGAVPALAGSPRSPLVAVGSQHQVLLYNPQSLELLGILPFPEGLPQVFAFSRTGALLLAGGGQGAKLGKIVLFDVASGSRLTEIGEELDAVLAADLSPDQSRVALGGPNRLVKIFNTANGALVRKVSKHTDWITAIAYSPDGVLLATGDRNGGLRVWEAASGQEFYTLGGHKAAVTSLAFRADSNILASASEDGTVKLWNMNGGGEIKSFVAHGGQGVLGMDMARDGRIVTAGRDRMVRLWKADGSAERDLETFSEIAIRACFAHDGAIVVSGDFSGEVRVTQTADAKRIGTLDINPPPIESRLAAAEQVLSKLQPAGEKAAADLQVAEAQLATAQQAYDQAAAQLASAQADQRKWQTAATRADLDQARVELASRETEHAQATQALQQAQAAIAAATKGLAEVQQIVAQGPQQLKQKQDQASQAQAAVAEGKKQLESLRIEIAQKQVQVGKATELLEVLEAQPRSTTAPATAPAATPPTTAPTSSPATAPTNSPAVAKAKDARDLLAVELVAAQQALATSEAKLAKAQADASAAEAAVQQEQAAQQAAQQQLEKLKQAVTSAEASSAPVAERSAAADKALTAAKAKVDQLSARYAQLKSPATAPTTQGQ